MRGRLGALAGALVLLAAGLAGPGVVPSAAGAGRPLPTYLSVPPEVQQLVTVTSDRWSATRAQMSTWERRDDGSWRRVRGPVTVRLGNRADPGTALPNAVVLGFNLPTGVRWSSTRRQYVAREPADTRRSGRAS